VVSLAAVRFNGASLLLFSPLNVQYVDLRNLLELYPPDLLPALRLPEQHRQHRISKIMSNINTITVTMVSTMIISTLAMAPMMPSMPAPMADTTEPIVFN